MQQTGSAVRDESGEATSQGANHSQAEHKRTTRDKRKYLNTRVYWYQAIAPKIALGPIFAMTRGAHDFALNSDIWSMALLLW